MRVSVFTKVEGMVVMESATLLVKAEVAEDGILETERVKLSGLSAVQVREKSEFSSMLYLLVSPSITLSEELRESMGGGVRSVVNSREPAGEGRAYSEGISVSSSDLQSRDTHIDPWSIMCTLPVCRMQDYLKEVYVCKCITLDPLTTNTGPVSYDQEQVQGVWGCTVGPFTNVQGVWGWRQAHRGSRGGYGQQLS